MKKKATKKLSKNGKILHPQVHGDPQKDNSLLGMVENMRALVTQIIALALPTTKRKVMFSKNMGRNGSRVVFERILDAIYAIEKRLGALRQWADDWRQKCVKQSPTFLKLVKANPLDPTAVAMLKYVPKDIDIR